MVLFYLSLLSSQEDQDKFKQLYLQYSPLMHYVAYQILKNKHLAEEAVHESFIKVINSFYKIEDVDCHKTKRFLVVVTENAAIDILRKEKPDSRVSYGSIERRMSTTPDMLENIAVEELADIIAGLPDIYRAVLELRAYHQLSDKQIATVLDISHATVRKRLERARAMLTAEMSRWQKGEAYGSVKK